MAPYRLVARTAGVTNRTRHPNQSAVWTENIGPRLSVTEKYLLLWDEAGMRPFAAGAEMRHPQVVAWS